MKLSIITFFLTLAAYVSAAALAFPEDEDEVIQAIQRRDIQSVELDDGRQELRIYDEDTYHGSIFITTDGERSYPHPLAPNPSEAPNRAQLILNI